MGVCKHQNDGDALGPQLRLLGWPCGSCVCVRRGIYDGVCMVLVE